MATLSKRIHLYNRQFLSVSAFGPYYYDVLNTGFSDVLARLYPRGVTSGGILSSNQASTLTLSATSAIAESGHLIDIPQQLHVPFANVAATTYYVGIKYVEVEVPEPTTGAIETNPLTSVPEYVYWQEQIGELGSPDTVIDNGDETLTIRINGVVGSDSSKAGRTARVWLSTPLSTASGWYEDLIIKWDGTYNYVITSGDFHQSTVRGSISTVASMYRVWMSGITITKSNISSNSNYIYLGTVTGNASIPTVFDQSAMTTFDTYGAFSNNIAQLSKDVYGTQYVLNADGLRSTRSSGTFINGDSTPDISQYDLHFIQNTAATNITALDNGAVGDKRTLISTNSNTTLKHSYYLALADDVDFNMLTYDSITLLCEGVGTWRELYRTETSYYSTSTTTSSSTTSSSSSISTMSTLSTSSSTSSTLSTQSTTSSSASTISTISTMSGPTSSSSSSSSSSTCSTSSSSTSTMTSTSSSCTTSTTTPGVWALGGSLNHGIYVAAGAGTQTAGLIFGGYDSTYRGYTEEYDGTSWADSGSLNNARSSLAGCGLQTAALSIAGEDLSGYSDKTEKYNGLTWAAGGDINTARKSLAACGSTAASLCFGGTLGLGGSTLTEEYDGISWSYAANLTGRFGLAGVGSQSAALSFGGNTGSGITAHTQEYNGANWTTEADMSVARESLAGAGSQHAALSFGGYTTIAVATSEKYNGITWQSTDSLNTTRFGLAGCGITTAALSMGGAYSDDTTEEYTV